MRIINGTPHPSDILTGAIFPRRATRKGPSVEERRAQRLIRTRLEEIRETEAQATLADIAAGKQEAHCTLLDQRTERRRRDAVAAEQRAAELAAVIGRAPDSIAAAQEARRAAEQAEQARARVTAREHEIKLARGELARLQAEAETLHTRAATLRAALNDEPQPEAQADEPQPEAQADEPQPEAQADEPQAAPQPEAQETERLRLALAQAERDRAELLRRLDLRGLAPDPPPDDAAQLPPESSEPPPPAEG